MCIFVLSSQLFSIKLKNSYVLTVAEIFCRIAIHRVWKRSQPCRWHPLGGNKPCFATLAIPTSFGGGRGKDANREGCNMDVRGANRELNRLCKKGELKEAVEVLDFMEQRGVRGYQETYASLLQVSMSAFRDLPSEPISKHPVLYVLVIYHHVCFLEILDSHWTYEGPPSPQTSNIITVRESADLCVFHMLE